MSNCVDLANARVVFSDLYLDGEALVADLNKHRNHDPKDFRTDATHDEDGMCSLRYWFLVPDDETKDDSDSHNANVYRTERSTTIVFGQGRSSHTWRDLRWTVSTVNKYLKKEMKHAFQMKDESEDSYGYGIITFKPNSPMILDGEVWE